MSFDFDTSRATYCNLLDASKSVMLSQYIQKHSSSDHCIIATNIAQAHVLYEELAYLLPHHQVLYFNDLELLPYDRFSSSEEVISQRMRTLSYLLTPQSKSRVVITAPNTLLKRLPPKSFIIQHAFQIAVGSKINLSAYQQQLVAMGYHHVNQVLTRGEFSIRGSLLDIFPMGADIPYRFDMFDDEVDSIRYFDLESQRSLNTVDKVEILPAQEYSYQNTSLREIDDRWERVFGKAHQKSDAFKKIIQKSAFGGIEFYLPLFHSALDSLLDYLSDDTQVHHLDDTYTLLTQQLQHIAQRYEQVRLDTDMPALPVNDNYLSIDDYQQASQRLSVIKWLTHQKSKAQMLPLKVFEPIYTNFQLKQPYQPLLTLLDNADEKKVIFCAESSGRVQILFESLKKLDLNVVVCDNWNNALKHRSRLCLINAPLQRGFILSGHFITITEADLYQQHIPISKLNKRSKKDFSQHSGAQFKDLTELNDGEAVVHINHGIGRYRGLTKLEFGDNNNEFLCLEYAKQEMLYVPIDALHLVSRYSGIEVDKAPLSKLGTDKWEKDKEKAVKKINDVAADLLEAYAHRAIKSGRSHRFNEQSYLAFSQGFPFQETEDQLQAINDVIQDMISPQPMDRLICGDVGFGKTEVAMRAAFIAVDNNTQVAILAPTTLLAQQHYENFQDRFAELGASVELLTRFKSVKQQNQVMKKLADGQVDILIGTHKLLSPHINFANLGLLIIDEEHRFGVEHKEKMKSLRAEVDILTMSATPIPRTLNMAFSQIRDLSIIATPPAKRLSVKTFVKQYDKSVIQEAIMRETMRGGQVFYLYNHVDGIYAKQERLQQLFPDLTIAIAHGQMRERELENVMHDFQHNRFHILLCTTIIETGIDIPNANTLIIENAERFGLAQLHQLRGRVGRSHHQAYAYLITGEFSSLSADAKKRLEAIKNTESLGGGYLLANHDLEIRGAGEILGKEQSGNIQGVGFSLYMDLLQRTIQSLKAGKSIKDQHILESYQQHCEVELRIPSLIPEEYIYDVHLRLGLYKQLSSASSHAELDAIKVELIDRFGRLPTPTEHLIQIGHIRLNAEQLGIGKIELNSAGGRVVFKDQHQTNIQRLIQVVQMAPSDFQLTQEMKLMIKKSLKTANERVTFITNLIQSLLT